MMIEWQWHDRKELPPRVLVVYGRTEYTHKGWNTLLKMLPEAYDQLVKDPHTLGIAMSLDMDTRVSWAVSVWRSYDELELWVDDQIEWLKSATQKLEDHICLRHNAYRMISRDDVPESWFQVEQVVEKVRKASPLGADAFPELSRLLGMRTRTGQE